MADAGYSDDPTISNEEALLRRIPRKHIIYDGNMGRERPTTAAFENHPDGSPMSVLLLPIYVAEVLTEPSRHALPEGFALASITAGLARQCTQGVAREPLPGEPAHAVVFGKKTYRVRKKFAHNCDLRPDP